VVLGFDARLTKEIRRRDAAVLQMKLAGDATGNIVSSQFSDLKGDLKTQLKPENLITQHPWISVILMKSKFFPAPQRMSIVGAPPSAPQRVVVEVVGTTHQKPVSPWKPILDAMMAGAPAVAAYAQQFMQGAHENGHGTSEMGAEQPQSVEGSTPSTQAKPAGAPLPASISRRTAPPPRENS
jgi:hypothetical protein